jgi:hyperosmotically inducible protein
MSNPKDRQLKSKVESAIERDFELSELYDVNVDVIEGEVQLFGIVDTLTDKNRLTEIIKSVPDVKYFNNDLTLSTDGPITDRGVEFEVAEELQADPRVDMSHIGAKSIKGKVFLVGHSNDRDEIQAAKEDAAKARGVTEIISQVKPDKTSSDYSK